MFSPPVSTKRVASFAALLGGLGVTVLVLLPESNESRAAGFRQAERDAATGPGKSGNAGLVVAADESRGSDPASKANRLASATLEEIPVETLAKRLRQKDLPPDKSVFLCQKLALCGSAAAMQVFFEAVANEGNPDVKKAMCGALDLLTNEEGIEALASIAVATGDSMILNAVEDCLSRCANAETVAYLVELHQEFLMEKSVAGRIRSMLEGAHTPRAVDSLGRLLRPDTSPELFRSAALALSKNGNSQSGRALVNATRLPLPSEHKMALREIITSTHAAESLEVFRDELTENPDDSWKSAYNEALEKGIY